VTEILDGRSLATSIRAEVAEESHNLRSRGIVPRLAVVVATHDGSSQAYVRSLVKAAEAAGVDVIVEDLDPSSDPGTIAAALDRAGADVNVHGVLLQTPLPDGVPVPEAAACIPPEKDIDGANPLSLGRLCAGLPAYAAATAQAVIELLSEYEVLLAGRSVTVVGRSTVVGQPLTQLLLRADATVTVCHSKTSDLASVTSSADVLVAAIGRAHFLGRPHVKEGAVVIDVGINVDAEGRLVGDVDGSSLDGHAAARSPVPGGVGPVTTAVLLRNVVSAALRPHPLR
jgi:methylenetetrahydrofolate dehydrogenase (NADP+)/methenyltetrahydrofolate cyclohydrolase